MHLVLAMICRLFVSTDTLLLKSKTNLQADFNCIQIRRKQTSHEELGREFTLLTIISDISTTQIP